ncbi:hypothetical protein E2C01_016864 [Portunus trituberculatus]|uniref:Uncharacterized protein n=1 Tax=Portunus trituberculatus TaxID=210409 RepID=A0A5B7DQS9_PORTR|nr:hypothetical protein [Portunus trituberculatus]
MSLASSALTTSVRITPEWSAISAERRWREWHAGAEGQERHIQGAIIIQLQVFQEQEVGIHPHDNLRQLKFDISLWGGDSHSTEGVHGEAWQLAGQLKHMVVQGGLVAHHGFDVQVNRDILQREIVTSLQFVS